MLLLWVHVTYYQTDDIDRMSSAAIYKHAILCHTFIMFFNSAFHCATESSRKTSHIFERYTWKDQTHTPSIAFRHLPPRKDVVNQCLEFGPNSVHSTADTTHGTTCLHRHIIAHRTNRLNYRAVHTQDLNRSIAQPRMKWPNYDAHHIIHRRT